MELSNFKTLNWISKLEKSKMADHPIAHPNLSFVSFSGNDSDLNARACWTSVVNKIVFSLGQRPTDAGAQPKYDHRQKSLFGSL